ncbi:hypothetical protein LX77_03659 [Gelidibacter algens]|uniref:Phosphate-selective porin O/P n=1 Tax=Gelidibacter algens TaxID=49280 RepID=A0A1A7R0N7_9FLAO|nr:hypothetical protein [Gelidibacter algens]OBX25815.1 hypothetical protein A9996_07740 [Gelidibacter algens]RAJ19120.1 hypothetical protein LX77_03659 [Gelidibacter algens]
MNALIKNSAIALVLLAGVSTYAQKNDRSIDNYREPDKNGINVFESPKDTISTFDNVKVRIGGSSTLQYQAIDHSNTNPTIIVEGAPTNPYQLKEIGYNFNLATANLDLDVALYDGVRMHLRTYLSSRHHPEPYVKGGYFQIDKLEFIKEGFLENFMKYATIKIGHMENNYGDAHFRRSDNAQAIYNPFVGNLIMDAFTTEVGAELLLRKNGFIGMIGMANGKLNQSINKSANGTTGGASFLAKLGYDKQINEDLRFRLTGSIYNTGYVPNSYLYSADRAGSRYYGVMIPATASGDDFRSGRYNPNLRNQITAIMINPFIKYKGLEFFGTIETANGKGASEVEERTANQFSGELIYRFGNNENFYIGSRYNKVDSEEASGDDVEISRFQVAGGWFMTKNILMKVEYVSQKYDGYKATSNFADGKFNGLVAEAVISF